MDPLPNNKCNCLVGHTRETISPLQRLDDGVKFDIITSSTRKRRAIVGAVIDREVKRDVMISIPCVSFYSAGPATEIRINEKEIFPFFSVLLLLFLPFIV